MQGGDVMKRVAILMALVFCLGLALTACGGSDAPKPAAKKGDRSESDFSASSMVKEVEEMQKAGQKSAPAPEKGAPAPAPAPAQPKK
jgi:predicted lipoprotein